MTLGARWHRSAPNELVLGARRGSHVERKVNGLRDAPRSPCRGSVKVAMPAPAPPTMVAVPPVAITVTADAATVFPPTSAPLHVLDCATLKLFAPDYVWLQWARGRDSHQPAHHAGGGTQSEECLFHGDASH
jgi:hypothetical protein